MLRRFPTKLLCLASTCLMCLVATLALGSAVGPEFQINTHTPGSQRGPSVTSNGSGGFVVVWQSAAQDGSASGIFGQRFDPSGTPLGAEFQINSYTTETQDLPAVSAASSGAFVVVWRSEEQDGSAGGIFGQGFDSSGNPQGGEFQVNSYTTGTQSYPAVASDPAGNFIVVWRSNDQDGSVFGVFGQRFDASATPLGSEFQINTYTENSQRRPSVAADSAGNFVVVWQGGVQDASAEGIFGQRFDASGSPQGDEFQINSYTTDSQRRPSVAMDSVGNFVVAWQSEGQDGSTEGVFGRRYDADGDALGGEFLVNSFTTNGQLRPSVASDSAGNLLFAWQSEGQDGSDRGVFGQRYDAVGNAIGGEFQINSFTASNQVSPSVGNSGPGHFVVSWASYLQDGSSDGVFGRLDQTIFSDGFESGNASAWDITVP